MSFKKSLKILKE